MGNATHLGCVFWVVWFSPVHLNFSTSWKQSWCFLTEWFHRDILVIVWVGLSVVKSVALLKSLMPRSTALCFMPEFSNRLEGCLVQWPMGLLQFWSWSGCGVMEPLWWGPLPLSLEGRQGFRCRSREASSPHRGHVGVAEVLLVTSSPVVLLHEREDHGVLMKRKGWPGPHK